eukprot:2748036-Rhodomonas_salina.1
MVLRGVTGATARLLEQQLTKALHWAMLQHKKPPPVVVSEPPPVASRTHHRRADKTPAKPPPSAPAQENDETQQPTKRAANVNAQRSGSKQRVQQQRGGKGAGARHPHA